MELLSQIGLIAFGVLLAFLVSYFNDKIIKSKYKKYLKQEIEGIRNVKDEIMEQMNLFKSMANGHGGSIGLLSFKVDVYFVKYSLIRILEDYKEEERKKIIEILTDYITLQDYFDEFYYKFSKSDNEYWMWKTKLVEKLDKSWHHKGLKTEHEYLEKKMNLIYKLVAEIKL